jgi:acyl carrier protein
LADRLISMFAQTLEVDPSSLSEDSSPDNTPTWDSLASMSLVAAIEEAFGVELSTKDIVTMRSIKLARMVLRRKGVPDV